MARVVTIGNTCWVCGKTTKTTVDVDGFRRWQDGELIQDVWPHTTAGWREQLISGIHSDCFDSLAWDEEE